MSEAAIHGAPSTPAPNKAGGWFGMMTLIVTEASLFFYLLFSYYYFALWGDGRFVPDRLPRFDLSLPDTGILLLSSVAVWWGEKGARGPSRRQMTIGLGASIILGAIFIGIQLVEWSQKPFQFSQTTYSALYFTITGFHMVHVVVGLIMLSVPLAWDALGLYRGAGRTAPVAIAAMYWHFVDVVWLAVFFTIYVTPHLGVR